MNTQPKDATTVTKAANAKLLQQLPFADRRDFEEADRGFVAPLPNDGVIKADDGRVVWDLTRFNFIIRNAWKVNVRRVVTDYRPGPE
jgi:alkyl sulfatase BDS1-like metallo-beta-lactamase superfamily hydrolase